MADDSSDSSSESEDQEDIENADKSEPHTKKGLDQATHKAAAGERIIEWWDGRFPLARIERKGVHIGWGVTCLKEVQAL